MISDKLKRQFKKQGVALVYLYGSEVTGFKHKESDVDMAVLLDEQKVKQDEYFEKSLTFPSLFSEVFHKREINVVVLNEAPPLLKHEVLKNGQLLFCADDNQRVKFEVSTVRAYEDTKYLRKIQSFYLRQHLRAGSFAQPSL